MQEAWPERMTELSPQGIMLESSVAGLDHFRFSQNNGNALSLCFCAFPGGKLFHTFASKCSGKARQWI